MADRAPRGVRLPSSGAAIGTVLALAGLAIGIRPLVDNSFFTHLATGRLILERGSVPSADVYSFTAQGRPWVVQSWLASWLYASVESIAGGVGLRLLMGLTFAGVVLIGWRLLRPTEGVVARLALGGLFIAVGGELWAERPLMLGLLALGATVLAAEGVLDPRWLLAIGWIWVNVHGSFPIGIVYLCVAAIGLRAGGTSASRELAALRWLMPGIVLGAIGPLGPRALAFPVELLARRDILSNVIEWRAPTFETFSQRMFVLQLAVAIVLLVRRPSYRAGLILAVFGSAALLGLRNVPVASLVMLPGMATGASGLGQLRSDARSRVAAAVALLGAATAVLACWVRLDQPDFRLGGYPVDALAFVQASGVDVNRHRLAAPDSAGNFQELIYGPGRRVFYDDRFDLFSPRTSADHLALVNAGTGVRSTLERNDIELVLWERDSPLGQRLVADPAWRLLYSDDTWLVVCKRGAPIGGRLQTC